MGLFSFVKSAGEMLGIGGGEKESESEALKQQVADLGLDSEDLEVSVEGEKVRVSGTAADQETKEKIVLAVGNVAGVSEVEESIEVTNPEPEAIFHTVASGDTLWKIAETNYGDGSKYTRIFEANKPMLKDPDKIYPGQVLRIPRLT